jgi:hypothetical protein
LQGRVAQDVLWPGSSNRDSAGALTTCWRTPVGSRNPCEVRERLASFLAAQPRSGASADSSPEIFGRMELSSRSRGSLASPIHRHECVKFFLRKGEEIAILNAGPASARYSSDFVTGQIVRESPINAFVEQQLHLAAAASMRSLASSRNAMTCLRETLGKPSSKSSIESPPSR